MGVSGVCRVQGGETGVGLLGTTGFFKKKSLVYASMKRDGCNLQLHHRSNRSNLAIRRHHRSVRDPHRTEHSFGGCIKRKGKSRLESRCRGSKA